MVEQSFGVHIVCTCMAHSFWVMREGKEWRKKKNEEIKFEISTFDFLDCYKH